MLRKYSPALILLLLIYTPASYAETEEKIYSACGSTSGEARKELGKSFHTSVKSSFSRQVTEQRNVFFDLFSAKTTATDEQYSKITLCNVAVEKKEGQFCASVSHKSLRDCAKKRLDNQMSYLIKNLPKIENVRLKKAQEWLGDVVSSDNLYTVVGKDAFEQSKLKQLISIENDLLKLLDNQYVRFDIEGVAVQITLNDTKRISPNQELALKVGEHSYLITSPGHCSINKTFELTSKGRVAIKHDMSDFTYPEITFTSKPPNAALKIGGNNARVGETKTIQRCDGVLPYAFSLKGVSKTGEVKLKPGLKKTITVKFTPPSIIETAKAYRGGKKMWQVQFHSLFPTRMNNGINLLTGGKISQLGFKDSFRWGYSAAIATDADNSYAYELSVELNLQLLDYNLGREALFLGPLTIIPSVGIEAGLAYHDLDGDSSFGDTGASNWEEIYQSYFLLRPKLGIDAVLNKDFMFSVNVSRSLFMNESNVVSAGLGLRF